MSKSPQELEQDLIEEASFEDLLNLTRNEFSSLDKEAKKVKKADGESEGKLKASSVVIEELRKKERIQFGLDKQISRSGFLVFEDRISKLRMMNTPLFLFGMKLYRQIGTMEFFDAEFCNTIMLKTDAVVDMSLKDACHIVNEVLTKAGFEG